MYKMVRIFITGTFVLLLSFGRMDAQSGKPGADGKQSINLSLRPNTRDYAPVHRGNNYQKITRIRKPMPGAHLIPAGRREMIAPGQRSSVNRERMIARRKAMMVGRSMIRR
jgi:hypothetical protein